MPATRIGSGALPAAIAAPEITISADAARLVTMVVRLMTRDSGLIAKPYLSFVPVSLIRCSPSKQADCNHSWLST